MNNHTGLSQYVAILATEQQTEIEYQMTAYSVLNAQVSLIPILEGFNASIVSITKK